MMTRFTFVRGFIAAVLIFLTCGPGVPAEPFPYDQELLLDAAPMRPGKRMPGLAVEPNGNARIDLWCRTVSARMEISEANMKIEADALPEGQPGMMSAGQCTPERMQADEELLATLGHTTGWRRTEEGIVLEGEKSLKFRTSDY
jgi:heat shock protein HslJ